MVLAILATLIATLLFFDRRSYSPNYVLRVVETGRDPTDLPRPRRQLAEYVKTAVFTSGRLLELVRKYDLYPSLLRKSPRAALESFREDIEIDVYKNYFVEERSATSAPRSARLSIRYKNSNQDVAVSVTRELGSLVVGHERTMRSEQSARVAEVARREVVARRAVIEARRIELASKRAQIERNKERDPGLEVELADLTASAAALELRQDQAEKREAQLAVGAALEGQGLGLNFEVVNDGALPTRSERAQTDLLLVGASLLFGLPLVVVAVGAFDPKKGRT
jgi:hypothetical protein